MNKEIMIGNHKISEDSPTFVIAEMSANHLMDFDRAVAIMQAAKDAGADAIKIQTYTPDTIGTLRVDYLHKMQRVYESEPHCTSCMRPLILPGSGSQS
jgi:sialic acid synthase SpsE